MSSANPTEHYRARQARKRRGQERQRLEAPYTDDYERLMRQRPPLYRKPCKNPLEEKEVTT